MPQISLVTSFIGRCLANERGDLSTYIAQGIMALAAVSLTGVVLFAFGAVGTHLKDIVNTWINVPISTGQ